MKDFIAHVIFYVLIARIVIAYFLLRTAGDFDPVHNKFFDWVGGFSDIEPPWLRKWSYMLAVGLVCGDTALFIGTIYWKIVGAILGEKDEEYDDQPSNRVTAKNEKHPSGRIMNRNLINILIVIAILVGLYYVISPYQNCYRQYVKYHGEDRKDKAWHNPEAMKLEGRHTCGGTNSW